MASCATIYSAMEHSAWIGQGGRGGKEMKYFNWLTEFNKTFNRKVQSYELNSNVWRNNVIHLILRI